ARALGAPLLPSKLADRRGPDARYLPAHARALARDVVRRARERVRAPR
ncbi:MAG: hypothetical protein QOG56_724, partial [Solirubrobacteraceae bacterium]|nr:hypothetical protein [Solirubrobacteraceae bacterium]